MITYILKDCKKSFTDRTQFWSFLSRKTIISIQYYVFFIGLDQKLYLHLQSYSLLNLYKIHVILKYNFVS